MTISSDLDPPIHAVAKVGYAAGNFGKSLIWTSLDYFLLFFLTDLWGLGVFEAGLVVTGALIWDGLCGPAIGHIVDRAKSPFGHYAPYLVFGAPVCAAAFWFVVRQPELRGDDLVWYALGMGVVFRTAYTICDVPHNALLARMSKDSNDAAMLSGLRLIFSALGGLCVAFAAVVVFATPDVAVQRERISAFAMVAGAVYVALLWGSVLATRRIDQRLLRPAGRRAFRVALLRHSSMLWLLLLIAFIQISTVSVFSRSIAYFADSVLGDEAWAGRALMLITVAQALSMPAWIVAAHRFDKRQVLAFAYVALALLLIVFLFTAQNVAWLRLPLVGLIGGAAAGCGFALWAMLPDAIDHGQWRGGVRAEALSTALFLLALKCASGLSALLLSVPLWLANYDTGRQGESGVAGTVLMAMVIIPISGVGICAVCLRRYDLGRHRHADIRAWLKAGND